MMMNDVKNLQSPLLLYYSSLTMNYLLISHYLIQLLCLHLHLHLRLGFFGQIPRAGRETVVSVGTCQRCARAGTRA